MISKDIVIGVKNIKTREFVGAITKVEFKNVDGKCKANLTWNTDPRKALKFKYQINTEMVCLWICSSDNEVFGNHDLELVIVSYDHLVELYKSSKEREQIRQKAIKRAEKGDISSKTLKEIYGNDLIDKLEKGQKSGIYIVNDYLITKETHIIKVKIAKVWFGGGHLWLFIHDKVCADIHIESYGTNWALTKKELL